MAKSKSKETSVPLIFALVFFILTTIAFGVMWYLAYSDIEQAKANEDKAKKDLAKPRSEARDAELRARVYRVYLGIEVDGITDDKTTITTEAKPGDVMAAELKKINDAVNKKLADTGGTLPPDFAFWGVNENNKVKDPPTEGLLDQISKLNKKDVAYKAAADEAALYKDQIGKMTKAAEKLKEVQAEFQKQIDTLPPKFAADLKKVTDAFDTRTKAYQTAEASANKKINEVTEERDRLDGQVRKLKEQVAQLQQDNQQLALAKNQDQKEKFVFDEPQGKILRKLPEGVVEINLGSAVGVKPGLTFTVLPPDFPEKGRQSRLRMLRVPDGRGNFKSVETFVPKGAIEIYEVVGPNLSLARIQPGTELDPIRDGVTVGDLLYNSTWRKGVADHIALIGIFDVNGDGADDIESVVRDLLKMGIPVDAYYDMKKRVWVGQVTERTRYMVEGYFPLNTATDPNRDEKTKLLEAINKAIQEGKQKGVDTVNFRDFFARMGYKFRLDVTDDKINQATAPYLSNVGVGNAPMPPSP